MNIRKPGDPTRPTAARGDKRAGAPTRVRGSDGVRRVTDVAAQDHAERDESSYEREGSSYQPRAIGPHEKTPLPGQRLGGALSSPNRGGAQLRSAHVQPPLAPSTQRHAQAQGTDGAQGARSSSDAALTQLKERLLRGFAAAPAERQAAVFADALVPAAVQNLMGLVMQRLGDES